MFGAFHGVIIDAMEKAKAKNRSNKQSRSAQGKSRSGDHDDEPPSTHATIEKEPELKRLKAQRRAEYLQRIPIEGKFGQGKNGYGLNYIRAKRPDTAYAWINTIFLVMNLQILLRIFFALLKRASVAIRLPLSQIAEWVMNRYRQVFCTYRVSVEGRFNQTAAF